MVTPEDIQNMENATDAASAATTVFDNFASSLGRAQTFLGGLTDQMKDASKNLVSLGDVGKQAQVTFGALTTAVLGTRDAFTHLGNVDTSGIHTFMSQFDELKKNIDISPAAQTAKQGVEALRNMLLSAGEPLDKVNKLAAGGIEVIGNYAKAYLKSADNALKTQAAFLSLSAQTGNLGQVYQNAGQNLENMNSLLQAQNVAMAATMEATGVNADEVEKYYLELGKIPKALEETVSSGTAAGGSMNMLTASIKLAHGTGRNYQDVVKDLHDSFKAFNITGEDSLKFVTRFSELSNKYGIELDDVHRGLMSTADAFKNLTDAGASSAKMTENVSRVMNDYLGKLKETGVTGRQAVDIVQSMTSAVSGLRVEQRAFLSAQTGGPGGLMGAAQIEKMIRSGDVEGVQKKVMETLKKQFGKVVTLDEATQNEASAAQRQKQIALLQQGPLGAVAKTPEDAGRLLEAMAKGGKVEGLDAKALQGAIGKGTSVEEKSYTELHAMNIHLEAIRKMSEATNLGAVQRASTVSAGTADIGATTGAQRRLREGLQGVMATGAQRGGETTGRYGSQVRAGMGVAETAGQDMTDSLNALVKDFGRLPDAVKAPLEVLKGALTGGANQKDVMAKMQAEQTRINEMKEKASKMQGQEKKDQVEMIKKEENMFTRMKDMYSPLKAQKDKAMASLTGFRLPGAASLDPNDPNFGKPVTPGAVVGAAPRARTPARTPAAPAGAPQVVVHKDADSGKFKIDVSVKVDELGADQAKSVTPVPTP